MPKRCSSTIVCGCMQNSKKRGAALHGVVLILSQLWSMEAFAGVSRACTAVTSDRLEGTIGSIGKSFSDDVHGINEAMQTSIDAI